MNSKDFEASTSSTELMDYLTTKSKNRRHLRSTIGYYSQDSSSLINERRNNNLASHPRRRRKGFNLKKFVF